MAELDQEGEQRRVARVKELEEMVKKLENENRQLLNKVRTSSPPLNQTEAAADLGKAQDEPSDGNRLKKSNEKMSRVDSRDDLEVDLVNLEEEMGEGPSADEWLFVSPKLPPTPAQKKLSPLQWLSEGHNRRTKGEEDIPSLNEVRKSLIFGMNEAENLIGVNRIIPGAESPSISPSLRNKNPTNRTAQKYLEQVRQRRNSPPSSQMSNSPSDGSPVLGMRPRMERNSLTQVQQSNANSVPIVRWKAKVPPPESPPPVSDEEVEEEEIPQVKWSVRQVPSESKPVGGGMEASLKIQWNPAMAGQYSSDEDELEEPSLRAGGVENGIPVVKWKAKVPQETRSNGGAVTGGGDGDVPVVKWKAKVPKSNDGDVPVVRWKAKVPAEQEHQNDVPVVKWKAAVPTEAEPQDEDVPVVRWKAKMPSEPKPQSQGEDVPVVRWKAKIPSEPQPQGEDVPVVRWKAKIPSEPKPQPQGEDVPVVRWKVKMPSEPKPQGEDVPVVRWKAQAPTSSPTGSPNQKRGLLSPRGKGRSLAPPSRRAAAARDDLESSEGGTFNGDSENSGSDVSTENLRVSRYTAHQSGLQKRSSPGTSTSRSPQAHHSPLTGGSRSRSPSPSAKQQQPGGLSSSRLQNSHISRSGLAPPRQGGSSRRNLSPSSQSSTSSQASGGRSPSSSPGGGLRMPRKQLQGSSSSPNQQFSGNNSNGRNQTGLSRLANQSASALAQNNSQAIQQQRTLGLKGSSSAPAGARSGLTPPAGGGQAKTRRTLPTPPSAANGGRAGQGRIMQQRVKQGAMQGASPKRINQQQQQQQRARSQQQPPVQAQLGDMGEEDDSWLEGCF